MAALAGLVVQGKQQRSKGEELQAFKCPLLSS